MLFLIAASAASKAAPKAAPKTAPAPKQEMGTLLELNQEAVLASYKGGNVKRKEVVAQIKATGMDLNSPQPVKLLKELEKRIALSLALQKYVATQRSEKTLSEQDKIVLDFIKSQYITKRYLEERTKTSVSDEKLKAYYTKLREKALKEVLYSLSICVLSDEKRAEAIVQSIKTKPKTSQKAEFTKYVNSDSLFEKKNGGALPSPLPKEKLKQSLGAEIGDKVVQYAKGSFIPHVFKIKGSSILLFVDNVQKGSEAISLPPVEQMKMSDVRPLLSAQIAAENRLPELKKIISEGKIAIPGMTEISDEYIQTAVLP